MAFQPIPRAAALLLLAVLLVACQRSEEKRENASGIPAALLAMKPKEDPTAVAVLMYHYIESHDDARDPRGADLFVPTDMFEQQLQWIVAHGYRTIDLHTYLALRSRAINEPKKSIILTFDDGYADAFQNVFPLLQKYHQKAVFYIVSGFLGKPGYMTMDQVKTLHDAGMTIAGHTVSHVDLRFLSAKELRHQLEESKKTLEALIDAPVDHFAYPAGRYNSRVIEMVQALGYKTAVTTHHGVARARDPLLQLPRVRMTKRTNLAAVLP
ncbi:polysaccharide deacetylase family protein [Candidatus Peregrinibacteria bacterium]|nr:polysaccharide deacetylase family protein [Candidatus Peregrinibacteria bacterium]